VTIPRWVGTGPWHLFVETRDKVGHGEQLSDDALTAQHLPSQFLVRSRTESTRPTVVSASTQPPTVDATPADTHYTVTVHGRDTGSGLAYVGVQIITPWMQQEGVDLGDVDPEPLHKVAGTRHDGTWQANIPVTRCWSDPGSYILRIFAHDEAGNHRGPVARMRVTVMTGDHQPPIPVEADPLRAGASQPVTYRFSEDVVGISGTSAPVLPGGPWLARTTTNEPPGPQPGTWACRTSAGATVDCNTGPLRAATWTPTVPLVPGQEYGVDFNPEHLLDVTDLAGNPIDQPYIVVWQVTG
jgi:hypothetical protein